jgi:hypothetical protein
MPPRATPADYQASVKLGDLTLAADFAGHSVPTPEAVFSTEDYVVVEVAFFGPPQARTKLSFEDFSLRINGKKSPQPSQPYAMVFKSLKDPEWAPPETAEKKSRTSVDTGGSGGGNDKPNPNDPPPVIHVPIEVERAMELKVQKAALPGLERGCSSSSILAKRRASIRWS